MIPQLSGEHCGFNGAGAPSRRPGRAPLGELLRSMLIFGLVLSGALTARVEERMLPRTIQRETAIAADGQSRAFIVYPEIASGRDLGIGIQKTIRQHTGVLVDLVPESATAEAIPAWPEEEYRRRSLILIGNISVNRALLPIYGQIMAAEDLRYPGGDGYTLRTVVNPFGAGVNAVVLGGSTPEGMKRATEAFCGIVRRQAPTNTLTIPGLLTVVPGGSDAERLTKARPDPRSLVPALDYQWTANPLFLEAAQKRLRAEPFMKPEATFYNPNHYGKERDVRNLIALIASGTLLPETIERLDNLMLRGLREEYNGYWIVHGAYGLGTRHQTCGMIGFLVTADYLLNRANPNNEAEKFLRLCVEEGHAFFRQFDRCHRDEGHDNGTFNSYGPITRYAMGYGDTAFFEEGSARLMARQAIMMTDNRGWFVAPGNYEDVRQGRMMIGVDTYAALGIPAFVYRDGGLKWIIENVAGFGPLKGSGWGFSAGEAGWRYPLDDLPAVKPATNGPGVTVLPLPELCYERQRQTMAQFMTAAEAVEMVCFRDRFESTAPYLFITGAQGAPIGRCSTLAANAIVRYQDRGHLWLIDQSERTGPYFRNALHVGCAWSTNYLVIPAAVRLDALGSWPELALAATTLPRRNGADWTRHVFWARDRFFLVMDTARFLEAGDFDLTCSWYALSSAKLVADHWAADWMDSRFELHNADDAEQTTEFGRARATEQMGAHPYILRQHKVLRAKHGEAFSFRNLFYTQPRSGTIDYQIKPVGDHAMIVNDGAGYLALAGIGPAGAASAGPLYTDARLFYVGADVVRLVPETATIKINGRSFSAGPSPAAVKDMLTSLWKSARAVKRPSPKSGSPAAPLQPAWAFEAFTRPHEEINGINVIDPPPPPSPDIIFSRQITLHYPPWNWPTNAQTFTLDLGAVEAIAHVKITDRYGFARPAVWRAAETAAVSLAFSSDNFARDTRTLNLIPDRVWRHDPPPIYRPSFYAPKSWRELPAESSGTIVTARYIRLPATPVYNLAVERAATRPPLFDWLQAADLDGDGADELIVATETGELSVLNGDGTLRWRRQFPNIVTAMLAADLAGAGRRTLYVADNSWTITGFDAQGQPVYHTDCADAQLSGVYALGTVLPKGETRRYLTVATGTGAACLTPEGRLYTTFMGGGVACDALLSGVSSAPLAAHLTGSRNVWGYGVCREIIADARPPDQTAATNRATGGGEIGGCWWLALGLEFWPEDGAPSAWRDGLAIVAAWDGIYGLNLAKMKSVLAWRWFANGPVGGYAFTDMDGQPGRELVVGRLDGFINVLDRAGMVIRSWPVGVPVRVVAAWPDGAPGFVAAVGDSIRVYDWDGRETGHLPAAVDKLVFLRAAGGWLLAASGHEGKIRTWRIAQR